jgi:hypothetical protein
LKIVYSFFFLHNKISDGIIVWNMSCGTAWDSESKSEKCNVVNHDRFSVAANVFPIVQSNCFPDCHDLAIFSANKLIN